MNTQKNSERDSVESTDLSSLVCDECGNPAFRVQLDAANHRHIFCEQCWDEHVAFSGNRGKPYVF
jgi:hypothetical protein